MKYYKILGKKYRKMLIGYFKSENDEDSLKLVIFSVLYGNTSPRNVDDLQRYSNFLNSENRNLQIELFVEKYEIPIDYFDNKFQWMIQHQYVEEITKEQFDSLVADRKRWDDTKEYLRKNLKSAQKTMAKFHKQNEATAILRKYSDATPEELKEIKTQKYWKDVCKHSHQLVHEWIFFDLPIQENTLELT